MLQYSLWITQSKSEVTLVNRWLPRTCGPVKLCLMFCHAVDSCYWCPGMGAQKTGVPANNDAHPSSGHWG